jgi:peroxisomal 3,2-trans-enoyl-CoA isomerase
MGVRRANDFLMFGRKCSVEEMESWGLINRIFPAEGFQGHVRAFLKEQLEVNDGKSMMETKRLQNAPLRDGRIVAMFDAASALSERFVDGAPYERFRRKTEQLAGSMFFILSHMVWIMLTLGVDSDSRRVKAKSSL